VAKINERERVKILEIQLPWETHADVENALRLLVALNASQAAHGYRFPRPVSTLRYEREPRGEEKWQTAKVLFKQGYGDCEDLTAARVVELRLMGEHAEPVVRHRGGVFHCLVRRGNGNIEDISRICGMGASHG
jgi:hypothetical protein